MKDFDKDVEQGLDCYDPETRVFPKITEKVSKKQTLSKRDILLILKWKLGRIKGSNAETVSDANLAKINEAIVDATQADGAIDALKALDEIPGIGLATATAMLTVCYPESFTIIDERVLESLDLYPRGYENKKKKKKEIQHGRLDCERLRG